MRLTKNKYINFLTELLIIFIGITLSFWFENYRQSNEDKRTEIKYLEGFSADLQKDKASLQEFKSFYELEKKSASTILKYYQGEPLNIDTFYHSLMGIMFSRHFTPNTNTFDEVISSSNMKLISDQSIKNEILSLRSLYSKIKTQEDHVQHDLNEYLYNNLTTTMDYVELFKPGRANNERVRKDVKKILELVQFKNFCLIIDYNDDLLLDSYESAIAKCDSLTNRIETKLKN